MRKLALLAVGVACSSLVPAVTLHYTGTGTGEYSSVAIKSQSYSYTNVFAGLLKFTVDKKPYSGYCLSPETWILTNSDWQAKVSLEYDPVGALIKKGFERPNDSIWQAATQVAIWEEVVSLNPTKFKNMCNGLSTYNWEGVYIDNSTTGQKIVDVLKKNFGYTMNGNVGTMSAPNSDYYVKYSSYTYINGQRISQDLGVPVVPGPMATVPFAFGLLAALKRRRK